MNRFIVIVSTLTLVIAAFAITSLAVSATKPEQHKVTICHATPPDTAANGYNKIDVDIASSGYLEGGHQDEHDADIIPPYIYGDFSYAGKNWTAEGQAIYYNDCEVPGQPEPSPSPSPNPSPSPEPSPNPCGENVEVCPSPSPSPTPSPSPRPTPTPHHPKPPITGVSW